MCVESNPPQYFFKDNIILQNKTSNTLWVITEAKSFILKILILLVGTQEKISHPI